MNTEVWRDIPNYEGYYRVSNKGRVKSLYMWNGHKYKNREEPKVLSLTYTSTGYKKTELTKDGVRKSKKVHRLVGKAFIPNEENKPEINHIDGNPINNEVENLEWCTRQENVDHAIRTKLVTNKLDYIDHKKVIEDYQKGNHAKLVAKLNGIEQHDVYNVLIHNNVDRRNMSECKDKYKIDLDELLIDLQHGLKNQELAVKYKCTTELIATRKYRFRKAGKL